jgi:hypothetical protein
MLSASLIIKIYGYLAYSFKGLRGRHRKGAALDAGRIVMNIFSKGSQSFAEEHSNLSAGSVIPLPPVLRESAIGLIEEVKFPTN